MKHPNQCTTTELRFEKRIKQHMLLWEVHLGATLRGAFNFYLAFLYIS